ncbi:MULTISPECIES: GNAT family N-acetyltransferase [unclassified Paenibacillus]|uniref:GNAT family N-acetyltransferase n=1 Tax=unclassified Paenibacillus TaxID=185978 RepID=UPI001C11947C|nr:MULTISPECIES: GNAT family N-acetyltransferase [unclassified Paenibacillus]MBU5444064.1 GNAT family N-acetyltransferase [Paenibacillus sp. MSJ-34]CAH0118670.1 hypothetical protein PAE9249_01162 [Paenibacillus sp. CECT 9249]
MIEYRYMTQEQADKLQEIDRSEYIDVIYEMRDGIVTERKAGHDCANWNETELTEIKQRYLYELQNGGLAIGAFDGNRLAGFGVLAHTFRGMNRDRLQIDLMYVSKNYRRQGIGSNILNRLAAEAKGRGAKYLYISSTETGSAVSFYKRNGSQIADEIDEELFLKEPKDIHMIKRL